MNLGVAFGRDYKEDDYAYRVTTLFAVGRLMLTNIAEVTSGALYLVLTYNYVDLVSKPVEIDLPTLDGLFKISDIISSIDIDFLKEAGIYYGIKFIVNELKAIYIEDKFEHKT